MTNFDPVNWLPYSDPNRIQSERLGEMTGRLTAVERAAMFAALAVTAPWVPVVPNSPYVVSTENPEQVENTFPAQYYRDPVGRVYGEGSIFLPGGPTPVANQLIYTLPDGYRPPRDIFTGFPLLDGDFSGLTSLRIFIYKTGEIRQLDALPVGFNPFGWFLKMSFEYRAALN